MLVDKYFSQSGESYTFSRQHGSDFAKRIAGDFNPLHDPENKRFCIPGDLLFALTLSRYGVSQNMTFDFQGMVSGDVGVQFSETDDKVSIINDKDKCFLSVKKSGETTQNSEFIDALIKSYVAFSGKTFPHILVELMQQQGVMVNAEKPMVIYDEMHLSLNQFSEELPEVKLKNSTFEVNGKRGLVTMFFDIQAGDQVIGTGEKKIIMSGLREYEQAGIDLLVKIYDERRESYFKEP